MIRIEGLCTAAKLTALQLGNNQVEALDLALLREGIGLELGGIFGQWLRRGWHGRDYTNPALE